VGGRVCDACPGKRATAVLVHPAGPGVAVHRAEARLVSTRSLIGSANLVAQVWAGNPVRYVRDVTEEEKQFIRDLAQENHELANGHADEFALEYPMEPLAELATMRNQYRQLCASRE
jgi:hypothetical protein